MLPQRFTPTTRSALPTETLTDFHRGSDSNTGFSIGDLARLLRAHALFVCFCTVAAVATYFVYLRYHHPFYRASITLRLDPSRTTALNGTDEPPSAQLVSQSEAIETEAGVMKGNRVAALALESLTGDEFLQITGYSQSSFFPVKSDIFSAEQERVLDSIGSRTVVTPQEGSQLVTVEFRDQNPALAALMVNRLFLAYERQGVEKRKSSVEKLRSLLTAEITTLKSQLDT